MKQFIRIFFIGLLLFVVAYVGTIACLALVVSGNYVPNIKPLTARYGHMLSRLREADTVTHADIMIMGSSHAYRGFDTRLFKQYGYRAFNLGSSSQTPLQAELLLEEYIDRMNPEMVILEVMPTTFANDGTEAAVDILSNHRIDGSMVELTARVFNPIVFNTFVYSAFRRVARPLDKVKESPQRSGDTYVPGGFVATNVTAKPDLTPGPKERIEFRSNQLRAFYGMLDKLEKRGTKVLLVYAPVTRVWYNQIENSEEIQDFFKAVDAKYGVVTYYDYSRWIGDNDGDYFYDQHHLNQKGVELFNDHFLEHVLQRRDSVK